MPRNFFRYAYYLMCCLLLVSCASPKMSQELEQGKMNFIAGNYKYAFRELLPVAAKGNAQAQYAVGYMYYYGYGASQDSDSGIFWMQKAAAQNFEPAVKALGMIHHKAIVEKNKDEKNNDEGYLDLTLNSVHGPVQRLSQKEDDVMEAMMQENKSINSIKPALLAPVRQTKKPKTNIKTAKTLPIKINLSKSTCYWGSHVKRDTLKITRVRYVVQSKTHKV